MWAMNADLEELLSEITHNLKEHPHAQEEFDEKRKEYICQAEQNGKLDDIYVLYMHLVKRNGIYGSINHRVHYNLYIKQEKTNRIQSQIH